MKKTSRRVMSMEAYSYREEMLDLREKLLEAEAQRLSGAKTYSLDEVSKQLNGKINYPTLLYRLHNDK